MLNPFNQGNNSIAFLESRQQCQISKNYIRYISRKKREIPPRQMIYIDKRNWEKLEHDPKVNEIEETYFLEMLSDKRKLACFGKHVDRKISDQSVETSQRCYFDQENKIHEQTCKLVGHILENAALEIKNEMDLEDLRNYEEKTNENLLQCRNRLIRVQQKMERYGNEHLIRLFQDEQVSEISKTEPKGYY